MDRRAKFHFYTINYQKIERKMRARLSLLSSSTNLSSSSSQLADIREMDPIVRQRTLQSTFFKLKTFQLFFRNVKRALLKLLLSKRRNMLRMGLMKWSTGEGISSIARQSTQSVGDIHLSKVKLRRLEMQKLLRETMAETSNVRQQLAVVAAPRSSRMKLLQSESYGLMEVSHITL